MPLVSDKKGKRKKSASQKKKGFGSGRCLGGWEEPLGHTGDELKKANRPTEGAGENEFLRPGADAGGGVILHKTLRSYYFTTEVPVDYRTENYSFFLPSLPWSHTRRRRPTPIG